MAFGRSGTRRGSGATRDFDLFPQAEEQRAGSLYYSWPGESVTDVLLERPFESDEVGPLLLERQPMVQQASGVRIYNWRI